MENLAYTAKERALINCAYGAIQARLETTTYGERQLADALKCAKEGQRPTLEAKAHTVAAFQRGFSAGDLITATNLDGLARGHVMALILGAGARKRPPHNDSYVMNNARLMHAMQEAVAAQEAALGRYLDAIRTRAPDAA